MTDILPPINTPAVALSGVNAGRMDGAFYGPLQRTLTSFRAQIQTLTRVVSAVSDADGNLIASADLLADTAELNAIRATLGGGLMVRTPLGDWFARSLTGPAAGITVTFGDGFAGNPTLALANDLAALEGLAATGFAVRTGADTWTQRALAGTAGRIVVTNGDGVAGAPTSDLATVADAGGGTLQKTAFDAYGRKTGTSAATTTDLPEGSNLYHTAQRVRDTLLTGLSTATNAVITATDSVLTALGKLQAQVSGILANYVTTARTISTTAPLTGGGDLSANRTLEISAATTSAAGSMSAVDKAKLDGVTSGTTIPTAALGGVASAATAHEMHYVDHVGYVVFSGRVDISTSGAGEAIVYLTPPVASAFTALNDCAGAGGAFNTISQGCGILADTAGARIRVNFVCPNAISVVPFTLSGMYRKR